MSTTHTDGVVTIQKVEPNGQTLTPNPVMQANAALAGRVRTLEKLNADLRTQLSNQADTIVRQRKQITDARGTTIVVKDPQGAVENYRATIDQQRGRIEELRVEAKQQKLRADDNERELLHAEDLLREHRRTIVHLQESVTTLVGEVRGSANEIDRLRHLATCRLHHINSLEDVLEGKASLLATVNLLGLEEHLEKLSEDIDLLGEVVKEILDERTRTGVINR